MAEQITEQFRIPSQNYDYFESKIEELNKRAKRLKCSPILLNIIGNEQVVSKDPDTGFEKVQIYFLVEVSGQAPQINGWTFVASVEPDDEGHAIIRSVPGMVEEGEFKRFRKAVNYCDHCRTYRQRNNVYILRSDDKKYLQVGSKCLIDFLGHKNPMSLAKAAEFLLDAIDLANSAMDEEGFGGGRSDYLSLEHYLIWVSCAMHNYGWFSRSQVQKMDGEGWATADRAMYMMTNPNKNYDDPEPTEKDQERVKKAIAWIREQEDYTEYGNDYQANLYAACIHDVIRYKQIGTAASVLNHHSEKTGEYLDSKVQKISEWQGKIGEVITRKVIVTKVEEKRSTKNYNGQSVFYAYTLKDNSDGSKYKWAYKEEILAQGEEVIMTGKVKKHAEYYGIKFTELNYCKVKSSVAG